jgi:hypothetical protein
MLTASAVLAPAMLAAPFALPDRAAAAQDLMSDFSQLETLRAAWTAANQAAVDALAEDLAKAASPEEVYAAHARFVRATANGFSRQINDLAALLQSLLG